MASKTKSTQLPAALAARARTAADAAPPDLAEITREARNWRSLRETKEDLEAQLKETNIKLADLEFTRLPTLMEEARITSLRIEAEGNHPAVELQIKPYYSANIAASWSEADRQSAFAALEKVGAGDLIKTEVKIALGRKEREKLKKLSALLTKAGFPPEVRSSVHSATLTAFVKEQTLAGPKGKLPPLDVIGAKVSRICQPKFIEEEESK